MSDPEVPQPETRSDDDVVDSANEGLAEADAARAEVPGPDSDTAGSDTAGSDPADSDAASVDAADASDAGADVSATADAPDSDAAAADAAPHDEPAIDPDLAAFEAAEREHPGTFGAAAAPADSDPAEDTRVVPAVATDDAPTVADSVYAPPAADVYAADPAAETQIVAAEPVVAAAPAMQPIFVQAPEAPRPLGNRGTAGAIGLLAMVSFAVLYLGAILGLGAVNGDVTGENIGTAALAPLSTWSFWVPVVAFFLAFWLLGAIINRGRWGHWVIFGLFVAAATYGGFLLGQLFQAPFWQLTAEQGVELVSAQLFAPLAIASFVIARELTVWFGAWVARSGARKTVLNAEAQREYERTLEAGPTLSH